MTDTNSTTANPGKRARISKPPASKTATDALDDWSYVAHKRAFQEFPRTTIPEATYYVSGEVRARVQTILEKQLRNVPINTRLDLVNRIINQVLEVVNGDRVKLFNRELTQVYNELEYVKTLFRTSIEPGKATIARLGHQTEDLRRQLRALRESQPPPLPQNWIDTRNILLDLFRALYANETQDEIDRRLDQYVRQTIHLDLIRRSTIETIAEVRKFIPESEPESKQLETYAGLIDWQKKILIEDGDVITSIAWLLKPGDVNPRNASRVRSLTRLSSLLKSQPATGNWLRKDNNILEGASRNLVRDQQYDSSSNDTLIRLISGLAEKAFVANRDAQGNIILPNDLPAVDGAGVADAAAAVEDVTMESNTDVVPMELPALPPEDGSEMEIEPTISDLLAQKLENS